MVNLLTWRIYTSVCFSVDLTSRGQHVLQCEEADQALCPAVGEPFAAQSGGGTVSAVSNTLPPCTLQLLLETASTFVSVLFLLLLFLLTWNSRFCPCFYCTGNFSLLVPCLVCVRVGRLMLSMSVNGRVQATIVGMFNEVNPSVKPKTPASALSWRHSF